MASMASIIGVGGLMSSLEAGHLETPKYIWSTPHRVSCSKITGYIIQNSCAVTALVLIWSRLNYGTSCGRLCAYFTMFFTMVFCFRILKKLESCSCAGKKFGRQIRWAFDAAIIGESERFVTGIWPILSSRQKAPFVTVMKYWHRLQTMRFLFVQ